MCGVQFEVEVVNEGALKVRKATIGSGVCSKSLNLAVPAFNEAVEVEIALVHLRRKVGRYTT